MNRLRVLALEPYYDGSHRAFLDRWRQSSRHQWQALTLPAHHWKWRMRHAAVTFAAQLQQQLDAGSRWDVLFCSDMLSLAEFRGLRPELAALPAVAYFHENQLTYPVRHEDARDLHFALTNITTVLAADEAWFNSAFHRDDFLAAAEQLMLRMPEPRPMAPPQQLAERSRVESPGCPSPAARGARAPGPLRIAWAARWEHDKGPADLARALSSLAESGVAFEASVMGQVFREQPPEFQQLRQQLQDAGQLRRWGWQPVEQYRAELQHCDVFISTAEHEFFGLAALEAIAAGALPLLPRRLAYPELLADASSPDTYFYSGRWQDLASALQQLADRVEATDWWRGQVAEAQRAIAKYQLPTRIAALDDQLERVAR